MKINSINNNYQSNNTNFKGKFMKTEALNEYLKLASDSDLKKFNNLLKRMKTKNDNLVFSVNSFVDKCHEYYKTLYVELKQFNEKLSKEKISIVGQETIEKHEVYEEDFSNHITGNVIKKIHETLEWIYPEQKMAKAERENLLEGINKNLN